MQKTKRYRIATIVICFVFIALTFMFQSCGKKDNIVSPQPDGGVTNVTETLKEKAYYEFVSEDETALMNASYEYVDKINMNSKEDIPGLRVTVPINTTFTLNEELDVSTLDKETPLITIYPYNNTFLMGRNGKTVEAYDIQIRLTDCGDPDNYVVFQYHWTYKEQTPSTRFTSNLYYMAGFSGSKLTAMIPESNSDFKKLVEVNKKVPFIFNNERYVVQKDGYGTYTGLFRSDFYTNSDEEYGAAASENSEYSKSFGLSYYFDYSTFDIYAKDTTVGLRHVTNVGCADVYDGKAFKGFTGNKAYLSISAENYNASNANAAISPEFNVEITNILGRTGTDLDKKIPVEDKFSPNIFVENVNDFSSMLYIAKGENITIPRMSAYDKNLARQGYVVYSDYGKDSQSIVYVKDRQFSPNKIGNYTILYWAEDANKNTTTRELNLYCREYKDGKSLNIDWNGVGTVYAGEKFTLPRVGVVSDNVNFNVETYYKFASGDYEKITSDELVLNNVGEYSLKYVLSNSLVSYDFEYQITTEPSNKIEFLDYKLPTYLIKGGEYTLDAPKVLTYNSEYPTEQYAEIYVSEDSGEYKKIDYADYTVGATNNAKFKLKYGEVEKEIETVVSVVDVGYSDKLDKSKYFIFGNEITISKSSSNISFATSSGLSEDIKFINAISMENFSLEFMVPKDKDNFSGVKITLTDFYNSAIQETFSVTKDTTRNGKFCFKYGSTIIAYDPLFAGTAFTVEYVEGKIRCQNDYIKFDEKFSSDKVYLSISLTGVTGQSELQLKSINGSSVNSISRDNGKPTFTVDKSIGLYAKQNEIITLNSVTVSDVFSPFLRKNLYMEVKNPDGSILTSIEGVKLDKYCDVTKTYTIQLESEGAYSVAYYYTSIKGNPSTYNYYIYTKDNTPPTITLNDGYNEETVVEVKVDKEYVVCGYQASDNATPNSNLIVSIMSFSPSQVIETIVDNKIVFNEKGTWKIYYWCYDEIGNYSYTYYTVKVG